MENTFVQTDFKLNAFKATRIVFDDTDLVSMDVHCKIRGKWLDTTLLFTFRKFNDLLRFSGKTGEKLQLLVSDKLLFAEEQPYVIRLEDESFVFTTCHLDLYYIISGDITCFSVEDISPLPYLQQVKNLRSNIADFEDIHLENKSELNNALTQMASMYRYYSGLRELNLNENAARQMSGLANDNLFKLAYYASCQR